MKKLSRKSYVIMEIAKDRLHKERPMAYGCTHCMQEAFPIKINSVKNYCEEVYSPMIKEMWVKIPVCVPCCADSDLITVNYDV